MSQYVVKTIKEPVNAVVSVPGSKSITNRALFMAALSTEKCILNGVLFSDDSRHFLSCLISLGYHVEIEEDKNRVVIYGNGTNIPNKEAQIDVGSAGTAARFLTTMLSLSDGTYIINASSQMKKRPMKPLFTALESLGAEFTYLEREGFLPVKVCGAQKKGHNYDKVEIDISESTQFLSALMMASVMQKSGLTIHITSKKKDGSYVKITRKMMEQFGCNVESENGNYAIESGMKYHCPKYNIEPDVSGACYFYALAAITGGSITVRGVHKDSMQGDLKFLNVLEAMGCIRNETAEGINITGPANGQLKGVDVDMNDFSDQTMTLAAIAPYAATETTIRNVGHIRLQESDRIHAIVTELGKLGIEVKEESDSIRIKPGSPKAAVIDTYEDHRMAMAFALTGIKTEGIIINDYLCCTKTFENYFDILTELIDKSGCKIS